MFADVVTGASSYRFIFSPELGPGTTLVRESTNYTVFLLNLGSVGNRLQLRQSYSVRLQALVNGTWSDPGPPCTIFMAGQPEDSRVRPSY